MKMPSIAGLGEDLVDDAERLAGLDHGEGEAEPVRLGEILARREAGQGERRMRTPAALAERRDIS